MTEHASTIPNQAATAENADLSAAADVEQRLFTAALGAIDLWSVYLGDKLGLYHRLLERGPSTSVELAAASAAQERYVREWLEQQTVTGFLRVDDPAAAAETRRYELPAQHAEVLTDPDSTSYLTPLMRLLASAGVQLPALVEAYRSGGGVGWAAYGADMRTGQADLNRPWFVHILGAEWFPAVSDLHERLLAGGTVADVGCGEGWSAIGIAAAYPEVTVDGYDLDDASVQAARQHVADAGLEDRVRIHLADAAAVEQDATYDVVAAFECIHDLARPVEVLATMRRLVRPDGHVIVMDERVAEAFPGPGDDVERLMYGFSLLVCLPDGLSHTPSAGTGTVLRPETLRRYAVDAGFTDVEVLPIDNELWRFYRLRP